MTKLDARTIEELQLRAPWASKTDSELLYQRISMGAVLCRFDQCERELILGKLRSFKGLIPSLYEFFENLKCLDAWAGGLRWLCCLGPRDTMSTALANIFSGGKSSLNTALVQTSESAFKTISANLPMQRELGVRQLYAFAMRNHREIPQKPRRNNLLANPISLIDESKLRDLADLAHELGFQSMQITALRNRPKVASMAEEGANGQPRLVTDGPGELRKYRCGIPRAQHYEQDRCSYFIPYLHEAKDEQSNNITNFFRMRSVYLKFFGTLSPQTYHSLDADHLTFSLLSQVRLDESLHLASAIDQARHDSSKSVQQSTSKLSLENNTLEKISQELDRTRYQEQERQRLYFEQNQLAALKQENGQMREKISREQEALHKIHEDQKEKRQESCLERSDLLMLEQEQRRTRQRLIEEEKHLQKIEQDQECQRAELISTEVNLANLERQRAQEYQELLQKSSEIENEQMREKISREQEALHKIHEDQKEKRQESCLERSDLLVLEQEQRRTRQRLIEEEEHLQKIEQDQECQRAELISADVILANLKRQRAQEYQELSQKSSEITALEQKLINIQQKQKEQEQYLHSEAQRINESSPLRKTSSAAVQQQVTEASSSLVTTDPNVLTGHNSTDVAKIKMFDGSRVVSGPHTNKSEAVNSPEVRHGFTEASLSSTAKDEVRLCEPVQMAESGTVNNSEDTSQQCARHEFSTSASPAVIDNPETAKPRQVPETEALDDSEDIPTQCALTSPMELTPPATRRKVREAQSLRFAADQNVLRCESMEVTMTKPPRNHNLSAKTVMTGSPPPKRPQSDNHEEDVTTRMRQKGRNPTTNMKIQRLDHYRSIDRKDQED